uniref:(northern house mosquito) hypothetical protein n=1 Tax=Culex pipiens TaxID=7175 RepID=A0A8D8AZN9_CULPI
MDGHHGPDGAFGLAHGQTGREVGTLKTQRPHILQHQDALGRLGTALGRTDGRGVLRVEAGRHRHQHAGPVRLGQVRLLERDQVGQDLGVELDLAQIELGLGDEEPAERVLRQQLYHNVQVLRFQLGRRVLELVLDRHRQDVAEVVDAVLAALLYLKVRNSYPGPHLVMLLQHFDEPVLVDGPSVRADRIFLRVGHLSRRCCVPGEG